jgi:arylmalonate decarboxylase
MPPPAPYGTLFGYRAKIGLVIPSNNTVIEPEMWAMRPPGVSVHGNRILARGNTPEGIAEMVKSTDRAVAELGHGQMSVIAYACLATSLVKGLAWTREVARGITESAGCPATTAATATFEAVQSLGARRIAIATPYPDRIQALLPSIVAEFGLELVSTRNLGVQNSLELWKIPGDRLRAFAHEVDVPEAEALCIVATDLPAVSEIAALEKELGKPVVATNQAILWKSLVLAGIADAVEGFGRLLANPRKATA